RTQRGYGLLQGRAGGDTRRHLRAQADCQFLPHPLVGPVRKLLVDWNLYVVATSRRRAHRSESESALVVGVDQLLVARRHVGQDAQPPERIYKLVMPGHGVRYASAGGAVETVAAGDDPGVDAQRLPVLLERHV